MQNQQEIQLSVDVVAANRTDLTQPGKPTSTEVSVGQVKGAEATASNNNIYWLILIAGFILALIFVRIKSHKRSIN